MFFPESRLASCGTVIYAMACPITHFDLTCPHIYQDALRSRRVTPYLYYRGIKTLGLKTGPTNGLVSHSIDVKFYSPPALRQAFGCKDKEYF